MKCHVCGSSMDRDVSDYPFKVSDHTIVIIKGLPVLQCGCCTEILIEDAVMERVDAILAQVNESAELEVVHFAA